MPDSIHCDLAQIVRRTFAKTLPIQIDRTKVEKVVCLRYHWRVGCEPANIPPNRRANARSTGRSSAILREPPTSRAVWKIPDNSK